MLRGGLCTLLLALAGCQARFEPPQTIRISAEAEALAGRRAAPVLERQFGGLIADPAADARLRRIGARLSAGLPDNHCRWQFSVLQSQEVNAFSLPGGLVYITRGLYQRIGPNDDLLAATLAHEMSHVLCRDSLQPPCATPEAALTREQRADGGAVALLTAAGYDAGSMGRLLDLTADVQPADWLQARRSVLATPSLPPVQGKSPEGTTLVRG